MKVYRPYTYELLWSEILAWTEKSDFSSSQLKFQTAGEISNSGENSKQLEIIKKNLGRDFFLPRAKILSIRSIFKTEVIRTKIVDWGFPRYIYITSTSLEHGARTFPSYTMLVKHCKKYMSH